MFPILLSKTIWNSFKPTYEGLKPFFSKGDDKRVFICFKPTYEGLKLFHIWEVNNS